MQVTATPAPKSSVLLEVEVPLDRVERAVGEAVRRLARQTRVPGFRPGKAPRPVLERVLGPGAVFDEAVEIAVRDAYREAVAEADLVPLTEAEVEVVSAEEGKPLVFKATVQVRPEVRLGDYRNFPFSPEIEAIDDAKVDRVVDELRDQQATLAAVEGRGARNGDYAIVGFVGTVDGEPFEGGSVERMPLILGEERLLPGFEAQLLDLAAGATKSFEVTFPEDYGEASLAGRPATFDVELKELRERILPDADDDFAQSLGDFPDMAALRTEVRGRLEANAIDRARHDFADRIIEYAGANATVELPDVLVDQEVEVMHDEMRMTLARQGIDEAAYLKATERTEGDLHKELREPAEKRVKTLLVLSRIADAEGLTVPAEAVEHEVELARRRYAENPRLVGYFDSERGRSFIRSSLRRTRVVEQLIDDWLAAHPDHPPLVHLEDVEQPTVEKTSAQAAAAISATDPSVVLEGEAATAGPGGRTAAPEPGSVDAAETAPAATAEAADAAR
jgi:trigger factor